MKEAFNALMDFLEDHIPEPTPDNTEPRVIKSPKKSQRKGLRVCYPKPFDIAELTALVVAFKPHWIVDDVKVPTQNKATGQWYTPSVFIGPPFGTQSRDEMLADIMDWD